MKDQKVESPVSRPISRLYEIKTLTLPSCPAAAAIDHPRARNLTDSATQSIPGAVLSEQFLGRSAVVLPSQSDRLGNLQGSQGVTVAG
jgi:hypothetical protein